MPLLNQIIDGVPWKLVWKNWVKLCKSLFLVSRGVPRQTIFTYSEGQNGLVRVRHTNLLNSWLSWSFYNHTCTFSPLPLSTHYINKGIYIYIKCMYYTGITPTNGNTECYYKITRRPHQGIRNKDDTDIKLYRLIVNGREEINV